MISASAARPALMPTDDRTPCGGDRVLDLAICMILAVAIVGLLMLAL